MTATTIVRRKEFILNIPEGRYRYLNRMHFCSKETLMACGLGGLGCVPYETPALANWTIQIPTDEAEMKKREAEIWAYCIESCYPVLPRSDMPPERLGNPGMKSYMEEEREIEEATEEWRWISETW